MGCTLSGVPQDRTNGFDELIAFCLEQSREQVRGPVYTSSINRWKRYGSRLDPLIKALGPLAGDAAGEQQVE